MFHILFNNALCIHSVASNDNDCKWWIQTNVRASDSGLFKGGTILSVWKDRENPLKPPTSTASI
jgi:hypothetical protein